MKNEVLNIFAQLKNVRFIGRLTSCFYMIKNYEKDKILDSAIESIQSKLHCFNHILTDYIYFGKDDDNHPVLVNRNKQQFKTDFDDKLQTILSNLENIEKSLSSKNKKYQDDHLAKNVFNNEIKVDSLFFCYNICVIEKCYKYYLNSVNKKINEISEDQFHHHIRLKGEIDFLHELTLDVSDFLDKLYIFKFNYYTNALKNKCISESELLFSKKIRQHSIKRNISYSSEVYNNAQNTLNRFFYYDSITYVPTAIFQIRQCIELRLWEIFGIESITDNNNKLVKITADSLLDLKGLGSKIDLHLDLANLKLIHKWTNIYIHRGISHTYWNIFFAIEYINDFINTQAIADDKFFDKLNELIQNSCDKYSAGCNIKWKEKDCIKKSVAACKILK